MTESVDVESLLVSSKDRMAEVAPQTYRRPSQEMKNNPSEPVTITKHVTGPWCHKNGNMDSFDWYRIDF